MKKEFSQKIVFSNYILTILIVCLHSLYSFDNSFIIRMNFLIRTIADMAMPTFFAISAFLLFRKNSGQYVEKIKKRISSLVIPYFIWSILFYLIYLVLSNISFISVHLNNNFVVFSLKNMLKSIIFCIYIPQFWYIRILFILVVISFVFDHILKTNKKGISLLVVLLSFITFFTLNFLLEYDTGNIFIWLPLFWLIAWITYFYEEEIYKLCEKKNITYSVITIVFTLILAFFVSHLNIYGLIYYIWRMISPILFFIIIKNISLKFEPKWHHKQTFYIFSLHHFIINIVQNLYLIIFAENAYSIIIMYVLSVIISIITSLLFSKIIKKFAPKINHVLTGNRGV